MMKNSWQQLNGRISQAVDWRLVDVVVCWLLAPWLGLLLALAQMTDMVRFGLARVNDWFGHIHQVLIVEIDKTNLSLRVKYGLIQVTAWSVTVVLGLACVGLGVALALTGIRTRDAAKLVTTSGGAMGQALPAVIEEEMTFPPEVKVASDEALLSVRGEDLTRMMAEVETLTVDQVKTLSQVKRLNIALLYYYLGDRAEYQNWLKLSQDMDPNERWFVK